MKTKVSILLIALAAQILLTQVFSQNRAPSCWLNYQDDYQGDILINTINAISPSPAYTYYCAMQWNAGDEGGGYCGIQEHPEGRNYIFSIWDPINSSEPITAAYTHSGTQVENFGGEGTGLKSWNFSIGWQTDQWYSFITRAWNDNSHTMFGYWVYDHSGTEWHHLVTMDFPLPNVKFNSSTGSFIEDWMGNGWSVREVHHKEGWKRKTSDQSWNAFTSSYFSRVSPDPNAANYINNYDGGVEGNYYFMVSGGTTTPVTNPSGTYIYLPNNNTNPGFDPGVVNNLNAVINGNTLSLSWENDPSTAPQFSYHIQIFDNPAFAGEALFAISNNIPHIRTESISLENLPIIEEFYIQFYITDIFDNTSNTMSTSTLINNCEYLTDGLISYWKLDGDLLDAHGNNDWSNNNTIDDSQGIIEHCRSFNQGTTTGQYAETNSISLTNEASMSFWLNSYGSQPLYGGVLFKAYGTPHGDQSIFGCQMSTNDSLYFICVSANTGVSVGKNIKLVANSWYHFVWTFNGQENESCLYVNGNKVTIPTPFNTLYNPNSKFKMGMQKYPSRSFHGKLDEIGIWNRALTDNEVQILFNSGLGNQYPFDNIPIVADFEAIQTSIQSGQTINFIDKSTGIVNTWLWNFEGGIPPSSSERNPIVNYNAPGIFDVTLVSGNCGTSTTSTLTLLDYINVYDLQNGLLHYYKFDGDLTDAVGSINGINHNTNNIPSGKINQSREFAGSPSSYIETNSYDGFNYLHNGEDFTISLWEKHNTAYPLNYTFSLMGNNIGNDLPGIFYQVSKRDVLVNIGKNPPYPVFSNTWPDVFPANTEYWNHLVLTHKGTLENGQYTLFVNGVNKGSASRINGYASGNSYYPMRFGINKLGGTVQPFDGEMDEIAFWNRALSEEEISGLYNSGIGTQLPFNYKNINISFLPEGLFDPVFGVLSKTKNAEGLNQFSGNISDKVTIELAQSTFPYETEYSFSNLNLTELGWCSFNLPSELNSSYYVVVKHRNSIETWSATPVSFAGNNILFNFSNSNSMAYGSNQKLKGSKYCIYSGDVNHDGSIDTGDMTIMDNDSYLFINGYVVTDINGDGTVDTADMTFLDNNASSFVNCIKP